MYRDVKSHGFRYEFTPEETGKYYFCLEGTENSSLVGILYDSDEVQINSNSGNAFYISSECEANTTYYLVIQAHDTNVEATLKVSEDRPTKGTLTLKESMNVTLEQPYLHYYYTFTPEEAGTYYFYSEGEQNTAGKLEDKDENVLSVDWIYQNNNFCFRYECEANKTYYVGICAIDEESVGLETALKVNKSDDNEFNWNDIP